MPETKGYVTDQFKNTGATVGQMESISFAFKEHYKELPEVIHFTNGEVWMFSIKNKRYYPQN